MKALLHYVFIFAFLFVLAACGDAEQDTTMTDDTSTVDIAPPVDGGTTFDTAPADTAAMDTSLVDTVGSTVQQ